MRFFLVALLLHLSGVRTAETTEYEFEPGGFHWLTDDVFAVIEREGGDHFEDMIGTLIVTLYQAPSGFDRSDNPSRLFDYTMISGLGYFILDDPDRDRVGQKLMECRVRPEGACSIALLGDDIVVFTIWSENDLVVEAIRFNPNTGEHLEKAQFDLPAIGRQLRVELQSQNLRLRPVRSTDGVSLLFDLVDLEIEGDRFFRDDRFRRGPPNQAGDPVHAAAISFGGSLAEVTIEPASQSRFEIGFVANLSRVDFVWRGAAGYFERAASLDESLTSTFRRVSPEIPKRIADQLRMIPLIED